MSPAAAEEEKKPEEAQPELPPLPPWQETFIARYPRNFKIAIFLIVWTLLLSPFFINIPKSWESKTKTVTHIEAADSKAQQTQETAGHVASNTTANSQQPSNGIINDQDDHAIKMSQAPDIGLTEDTPEGSLPRVGEDGRQPWQVYARPFNMGDQRPRIAIVITDLGLSRVATDAAINRMPTNVTLAFDVQSPVVGAWVGRARQDGHETLLMVPMEPFDYPRSDPGPKTLLTTLPSVDILSRFNNALRQATGYVGITTLSGSRFTTDPTKLAIVLEVLRKRGLMIFDTRVAPHSAVMDMAHNMHVPAAASTMRLDQNPAPEAIDQALEQAEKTARLTGRAVIVTSPLPVILDHLQNWVQGLPQKGIALAPISAMVQ